MPSAHLTKRELEILELVAKGMTAVEIGKKLWLSPETIKSHLSFAFKRTGTRNRAQLVAWAFRRGYLR